MLTPTDFGLPAQFSSWRPGQLECVNWCLDDPHRFMCLCAPTGYGKSLAYMAMAAMSGKRTVVLTSTKGLQDQLQGDFEALSTDIRGMQNYLCSEATKFGFPHYTKVNDGPCQMGAHCHLRSGGCGYFDAYQRAQAADIVVTNYQCWMYDRQRGGGGLGKDRPVELLVLDECHDAVDQLCGYLSVEMERKECLSLGVTWPLSGYTQDQWVDWAGYWRDKLQDRVEALTMEIKGGMGGHSAMHEVKELKSLGRKVEVIAGMREEWVIEEGGVDGGQMKVVKFDPLWPRRYAEGVLFRGVPKVVLVSATVRPKTAELLGVKAEELAFTEYQSSFPIHSRPVIHVPTVRMNYKTEQDDSQMMWLLRRVDQLVAARGDRKGIIHTVSYKRARFLLDNSKYADRMMVHGSDTRERTIEKFREAGPGAVLVSPSVDTGYDFKDDLARYQIIVKIPYPDTRGAVLKARAQEDRDYPMYVTTQTLQQMTGRIVRGEKDWGETLIVDDNVRWIKGKYGRYLSRWWMESFRTSEGKLPEPL